MKNPYVILGIPQDATTVQIVKAQMAALRKREYDAREVAWAQQELRNPAKRLAVDFTFPILDEVSEFKQLVPPIKSKGLKLDSIDTNKYDSLK